MLRANAPWVVLKGGTSTWHQGCGLLLVRLFTGRALVLRDGVLWWVGWIGGLVVVVSGTLLGPEGTNPSGLVCSMGRDRSVEPLLSLFRSGGGRRWNRGRGFTRCLRTAQWTRASLVFASRMRPGGLAFGWVFWWCVCGC